MLIFFLKNTYKYLHPISYGTSVFIESDPVIYVTDGRKSVKPFCHNVQLPERTMLFYRITLLFVQYLGPVVIITVVYMRMALRLWGSHAPGNAQDSRDANLMRNKKKVSWKWTIHCAFNDWKSNRNDSVKKLYIYIYV